MNPSWISFGRQSTGRHHLSFSDGDIQCSPLCLCIAYHCYTYTSPCTHIQPIWSTNIHGQSLSRTSSAHLDALCFNHLWNDNCVLQNWCVAQSLICIFISAMMQGHNLYVIIVSSQSPRALLNATCCLIDSVNSNLIIALRCWFVGSRGF